MSNWLNLIASVGAVEELPRYSASTQAPEGSTGKRSVAARQAFA